MTEQPPSLFIEKQHPEIHHAVNRRFDQTVWMCMQTSQGKFSIHPAHVIHIICHSWVNLESFDISNISSCIKLSDFEYFIIRNHIHPY